MKRRSTSTDVERLEKIVLLELNSLNTFHMVDFEMLHSTVTLALAACRISTARPMSRFVAQSPSGEEKVFEEVCAT